MGDMVWSWVVAWRVGLVLLLAAGLAWGVVFVGDARALASEGVLPDGRVWELVSPLQKADSDISGIREEGVEQASAEGNAITYISLGAFGGAQGAPLGGQYLSTRDPAQGWSTRNLTAPEISNTYSNSGGGFQYQAFSSDLSSGLVIWGHSENAHLSPAPEGYENFYLHENLDDSYTALMTSPPFVELKQLDSATSDLQHAVLTDHFNLYEWTAGQGSLATVNVLPASAGGGVAHQAYLGGEPFGYNTERDLSSDGSHVFWSWFGGPRQQLYVRLDGSETIEVDASHVSGVEGGFGRFWTASSDGSRVFFTDKLPLTSDSTAASGEHGEPLQEDLYELELGSGALTDLTTQDPTGASVQGVLGASTDGSRVYFVADGVLAGQNSEAHSPVAGEPNLYEYVTGESSPTFITTLAATDGEDWTSNYAEKRVRVAANGSAVVFMSTANLTGENNSGYAEVYVYESAAHQLHCVSCNRTGTTPVGPSSIPLVASFRALTGIYQPRILSEGEGDTPPRVFFDTRDALVPQDTNNQEDVYEYEGGHQYLISSGTSNEPSSFVDASLNGNNVFFVTRQQLVSADTDELVDLYDARIGGGFPAPPAEPVACSGENCKPASTPAPVFGAPASSTFTGAGNIVIATPKPAVTKKKASAKPKAKKKTHTKKKSTSKKSRAAKLKHKNQ